MSIKGIDVSKWQGNIDFEKVKAAGYKFVMVNAGYGKYISQKDKYFDRNYEGAKAAGLHVGAYWYSYAETENDAKQEAEVFREVIKGKTFDMPVAFDIEEKCHVNLPNGTVGEIIKTFCTSMESAGYYVSLYSYASFLRDKVSADIRSKYDVWLAEFDVAKPSFSGQFGIWQHSAKGRVNGIAGDVDLNIAYKDYPKLITEGGFNGFPKSQKPAPAEPAKPAGSPKGDLNGDGKVDIEDVAALVNHINGVKPLE